MESKDSTKDKENIQNTLKALQEKSQHIEKLLEKGNDVLIFQFGSNSIKFGFANQMLPQKIKTIIGYYQKTVPKKKNEIDVSQLEQADHFIPELEDFLRKKGNLKAESKSTTSYKIKQKNRIELSPGLSQAKFEKLDPRRLYFEDDVYLHQHNPNFLIKQPIKNGLFNLSADYPFDNVVNDLEQLIYYILTKKLELEQSDYPKLSIVLIVPDVFHRGQVKALINTFLKKLAFQKIFLHQESVLATFGSCLSQACVVDIGSDKINICCVDEGVVIPQTVIRKFFGGKEIDLFLHRLLQKKNSYSYMTKNVKIDINVKGDLQQIETAKELACSYIQTDENSNSIFEGTLLRDRSEVLLITYNDSFVMAPSVLFHSDILNAIKQRDYENEEYFNFESTYFESYFDPEDYYEEPGQTIAYGPILLTQQMELEKGELEEAEPKKEETDKRKLTMNEVQRIMDPFEMQDLDHLICFSISQVGEIELRKKMANFVLISGGGCQILNTVEEFEDRLFETFSLYDSNIDRVEVINPLNREVPPYAVSWVGGTVIQRLDSMKELWVTRAKWIGDVEKDDDDDGVDKRARKDRSYDNYGVKLLREKLPFLW